MLQRRLSATEVGEMAAQNRNNSDIESNEAIGKGVGGVGGAAAGAAVGSLAGPVGTAIGALAGAVGGWWAGKAAADAASDIDASDDDYYQRHFRETSGRTSSGRGFDTARPAYQLGHVAGLNPDYEGRSFEDIEPHLRQGWTDDLSNQSGDWNDVRDFARNAFERGQERRLTLAEEQLAVGKRTVQEGEVALRKHVDTRHVEEEVELVREEVTVERRPLSADSGADVSDIGEEEIRVPVMREEAVVEKRTVPIEEVVVRKEAVSDTKTVGADLRRETLDVDENVDTKRTRTTRNQDEATDRR
jgi:uncharacterized protein (TIGR02271 family)